MANYEPNDSPFGDLYADWQRDGVLPPLSIDEYIGVRATALSLLSIFTYHDDAGLDAFVLAVDDALEGALHAERVREDA